MYERRRTLPRLWFLESSFHPCSVRININSAYPVPVVVKPGEKLAEILEAFVIAQMGAQVLNNFVRSGENPCNLAMFCDL